MASTAGVSFRWRAVPESTLLVRRVGDHVFAYHAGSGDTHQLAPLAWDMLEFLRPAPRTVEELVTYLAARHSLADDAPMRAEVSALIDRFDQMGLVEPAP